MRVLHVITGPLAFGGAEVMLYRLVAASRAEVAHEVMSLTELGPVADRIRELGVPVHALGMARNRFRIPDPVKVARLAAYIRRTRPDVVQTWLYHADLLGGFAARLAGAPRIVWGIHNSTLDATHSRVTTRWTAAVCAHVSRWIPHAIVSVSRTARELHVRLGYDPRKFVIIPNGFDADLLRPDPVARRAVREELGIPEGVGVIGMIARVDPQKDHPTFIRAAAFVARRRRDALFLLCGEGAAPGGALAGAIAADGLGARFLLLGRRDDVPRVLNALDVCTLSSAYGEAFPLVVGEAMACGVPCVVTDLGDCAHLVGDTGTVVPPRDPEALARAWEALLNLGLDGRRSLGVAARDRILANFALARITREYLSLYGLHGPENEATPPPATILPSAVVAGRNAK
jgi:glycosyltransferase involved in cell wall biosynthesis